MKMVIGAALLVGGIVLLVFGFNASESAGSEISRFFTGNPTDRAVGLVVGGVVAAVAGLGILAYRGNSPGKS